MSRNTLAFAVVMLFSVGLASGQDAKKPVKDAPDIAAGDEAKSPGQPKLVVPQAAAAKPKLRLATPDEKRVLEKGHVPGLAPSQRYPSPIPYAGTAPQKAKVVRWKREVIRLANSPAVDVAQAINEMLRSERAASPMPAGEVVIVPDPVSNSLVISAAPQAIGEIVELVGELDARPSMVVVRVLMAEITSEGKSSGDVILDDLSAFVEDRPDDDKKGTQAILTASHEAALAMVKKLAGQKGVEILARSQVTALDNQSAYVQVGRRVPRASTARGDKPAGVEYENVGIILGVTPRINPDGTVTMEIDFEKSEVGDVADGGLAPPIETIKVQTTVSVPDGQTLILGGLVVESGNEKHELLMVVTPHVVETE